MFTTILAYVGAIAGLVMIAAGAWGGAMLVSQGTRIPLRYYAIVIGMIATGIGLVGIAQALRLLLLIYATAELA
jgi:hypothetical protein